VLSRSRGQLLKEGLGGVVIWATKQIGASKKSPVFLSMGEEYGKELVLLATMWGVCRRGVLDLVLTASFKVPFVGLMTKR